MNIKVIGLGGIGGFLVQPLARFANYGISDTANSIGHVVSIDEVVTMTFVDGDTFEPGNSTRQQFADYGIGNKADKIDEWMRTRFNRVVFRSIPEYVTKRNAIQVIRESDIVFLGVDNHATRKLVSDRCRQLANVLLISGGNELIDGNVQVYLRKDGKDVTMPLANQYHPEIAFPKDKNPGEVGCDDATASKPQILFVNDLIAGFMNDCFYSYLSGNLDFDEVFVDLGTHRVNYIRYPR